MYRHCIYCLAGLGANEAVEHFPVGRTLAFDASKGRLWAVCPRCARWNLAPIEERWEAVEAAEKRFERAGMRVQRENVGLAKLPDGTRLIRVGAALPVEVATWRYGGEMVRRRWTHLVLTGASIGAPLVGWQVTLAALGGLMMYNLATGKLRRPIARLPAGTDAAGFHRADVSGLWLIPSDDGRLVLRLPRSKRWTGQPELVGNAAVSVLSRAMVLVNHHGANRDELRNAVELVQERGGAGAYAGAIAARKREPVRVMPADNLWATAFGRGTPEPHLSREGALALEIALHEQRERRAMEGELVLIERAWREAEEVAALADRLAAQLAGVRLPGLRRDLPAPAAGE